MTLRACVVPELICDHKNTRNQQWWSLAQKMGYFQIQIRLNAQSSFYETDTIRLLRLLFFLFKQHYMKVGWPDSFFLASNKKHIDLPEQRRDGNCAKS